MCTKRQTLLTEGNLQSLGASLRSSTIASFSDSTQRIQRRQFVAEKLWRLSAGTRFNFDTLLLEGRHRISLPAQEPVADQLFDEVCRVPRVSSCHLMRA